MTFSKQLVKENLTNDDVYNILEELGTNPRIVGETIECQTVCHGGDSPHGLVYFENSGYFYCRTHCGSVGDIFQLVSIVLGFESFNDSIDYVVSRMEKKPNGTRILSKIDSDDSHLIDVIQDLDALNLPSLPTYDNPLKYFPQPRIVSWEKEGINKTACDDAGICYDPINGAILIPHYDAKGNLIGIKSRTLIKDEEANGKYRMYKSLNGTCYSFPVAMDVYGLDKAKHSIARTGKAIIAEAEKSVLAIRSMWKTSDVPAVAVNGSNISKFQMKQLLDCGAKNIIVAFDRDFKEVGDVKYKQLLDKYQNIANRFSSNFESMKFIVDDDKLTKLHDSPSDAGKDVFLTLLENAREL